MSKGGLNCADSQKKFTLGLDIYTN